MRSTLLLLVACGTGSRPQVTQSDADLSALQDELTAVQDELASVQKELAELQEEQSSVSDLALEQSAQREEVVTLSDELSEAQAQIATLEETVAVLVLDTDGVADLLQYVTAYPAANQIKIVGANVLIQSGSGYTDDGYHLKIPGWKTYGLGNLIIGYDEGDDKDMKTGSHNIVVGRDHSYTSYGGLVVGYNNSIIGQYSSVTGGHSNSAEARTASVSGGRYNTAADYYSWVGGGYENKADSWYGSVMGGAFNISTGECGVLVGGDSEFNSTDLCDVVP